jgi:hypothetical protein
VGDAAACQNFVDEFPVAYLQQNQTWYLRSDVVGQKMGAFAALLVLKECDLLLVADGFCLPDHGVENLNLVKKLAFGGLEQWSLRL